MATTAGTATEQALDTARRLIRLFMNDTPELNRLIRTEESSDEKIDLSIALAINDYNITPPILGEAQVANFPSLYLLIYGASIQLLRSNGILQSRNELTYSSGGVSVRIFDKTQLYQSWIANFLADYERKKAQFKLSKNINDSLACGVSSEYGILNYFW